MAMMLPTRFEVAGSLIDDVHDPSAQQVLSQAKAARLRPLCLCQAPGVEMYIATARDDLIVKRMPGTAAAHDYRCRSWLPPGELSGYGAVAEQSIVDNPADGTTALRLGFSLSKAGNRAARNHPAHRQTPFNRTATSCRCALCCTTCGTRRN